jgi:hypothetical protein
MMFFNMTPKAQEIRAKTSGNISNYKVSAEQMKQSIKLKRQQIDWENIFKSYV